MGRLLANGFMAVLVVLMVVTVVAALVLGGAFWLAAVIFDFLYAHFFVIAGVTVVVGVGLWWLRGPKHSKPPESELEFP